MRRSRRGIVAVVAVAGITAVLASETGASASPARVTVAPAAAGYTVSGELNGVAAASNSNAWAVGSTGAKILMLHWNGHAWS